ncbi:MAG: cysteine dioxygenase family protein [Candidatus Lambdaproteobacteria bacterium]|nr:cysteine dioxygenase family protein [Candidatus Lambdaproteobacteria bacterium]
MTSAHAQQAAAVAGTVGQERKAAIAGTMTRVKAIAARQGISRESLKDIRAELLKLAAQRRLFPAADFRARDEGGRARTYRLAQDDDGAFSLVMSTSEGAKKSLPHNHTTWAVIVGVEGEEHNRFYERLDDGSVAGKAQLRETGGKTVRPGTGVCMLGEDIHSIETDGRVPTLHLHLYGIAQPLQTGRVGYDVARGTVRPYTSNPNTVDLR